MNQILKEAALLNRKAAFRKEKGLFTAEGLNLVSEVPEDHLKVLIYTERFRKEHPALIREREEKRAHGQIFLEVTESEFQRISDTKTPQGVMALVSFFSADQEKLFSTENGLFLFLERLQDPGNLGTVMRSAEASGVTAVFIGSGSADIYNPKTVRSTMGALFRVPFIENVSIPDTIRAFQKTGGKVYAAALQGSVSYDTLSYRASSAFLIGNEAAGLNEESIALSDAAVRIPMLGKVESLNAGVAASVLVFEAARQRRT